MEKRILNFAAAMTIGFVACTTLSAELAKVATTNDLTKRMEEIENAGDIRTIADWLSQVEQLWPQQSVGYETLMERTLHVLEKRLPTLLAMPNQPTRNQLLNLANTLGGVRSLRIPRYNQQPSSSPQELPSIMARSKTWTTNPDEIEEPELRREVQEAWQKYRREMLIYRLQSLLARMDVNATPSFLKAAKSYVHENPFDVTFIQEVANRMPLEKEERQVLENTHNMKP